MKDREESRREKHKHKHRHSSPEIERPRKQGHRSQWKSRSPLRSSPENEYEKRHHHRHHRHRHHREHHSDRTRKPEQPQMETSGLLKHIKEEPISDEDIVQPANHAHSRINHARKIKEEPRDNGYRPKERSRWENDDDSPNERDNTNRGRRARSGERFLKALKGESGPEHTWGKKTDGDREQKKPVENKAKPDFGLSGKLVEDTNMFNGVVIKYSEPPEARKPKRRWRLYPFKGDEGLPTLYIHRQSAYLIGRDRKVADFPVDHPSCSKQHAALQYRIVPYVREDGTKAQRVRPYIIDLESANGTYINNVKIEPRKYVELFEKDVIKFAYSSREYVLLHEQSIDDDEDDNVLE